MRMPLTAEPNNGYFPRLDQIKISIGFIKHYGHGGLLYVEY